MGSEEGLLDAWRARGEQRGERCGSFINDSRLRKVREAGGPSSV